MTLLTEYAAGFHDRVMASKYERSIWIPTDIQFTYTFENFFHPYVGAMIAKLNRDSLPGVYDPSWQATQVTPDPLAHPAQDFFNQQYQPTTSNLVQVEHFRKEIEVKPEGAYSNYNWELFFHIPLTIAVHLSKTQRFAEAQRWFHYIFDPTSNDQSVDPPMRFWRFLAFRNEKNPGSIQEQLRLLSKPDLTAEETHLRDLILDGYKGILSHPFQPHRVARTRHIAYQYCVVMKYLDNLIAWGDQLFAQDSIESINEATQRYVLAANLLGERPERVPTPGTTSAKTFAQLKADGLDAMGNALEDLEAQFPFDFGGSSAGGGSTDGGKPMLGIARTLYFCVPQNDKLLGYWDTVADRLFKIRHCMNIQGIVRPLALFDPPIDPGLLVKAAAAGIDIGSIVSGLNQPIGPLRCLALIQKAIELCGEVRSLGGGLLAAIEKGDSEHLGLIRQRHEIKIQQMTQDVRFLQWKSAEQATQSLLTNRATALERLRYYARLLGLPADQNAPETFSLQRTALDEENFDDAYQKLVDQYDKLLGLQPLPALQAAGSSSPAQQSGANGAGRLYLTRNEDAELNVHLPAARDMRLAASAVDMVASVLTMLPAVTINLQYWGLGASPGVFDGAKLGAATKIAADILRTVSAFEQDQASMASRTAGHERRADDWLFQYNLAAHELMQIGRQILTSLISEQIAHHEYLNTQQQIANSQEVDQYLHDKFTNEELHLWMQGEISRLYYEYYRFAFDTARKAERTMKQEVMRPELDGQDFVKFNYWDGGRKGLLSGEALHLDVKRMEMAYHDNNKRELELTRHVSLRQIDPAALLALKATGSCQFSVPEWLYDRDCPGHYLRRIKSVAVSIPSVVGPYTSIHCTLSLLKSSVRKSPIAGDDYARQGSEDSRFTDYAGGAQSMVTSTGANDAGMFETNLRDDRFLPFEGAGAISTWKLDLPAEYRSFDYATISDVILHIRYTARQGVEQGKVSAALKDLFQEVSQSRLSLLFSLRHDFPTEWSAFVNGAGDFTARLQKTYFPYLVQSRTVTIEKVDLYGISGNAVKSRAVPPAALAGDLNADGHVDLTIAPNDVLKRDTDAMPFVIVQYSI
jgi:receptor-binding and translocation channel-forming TcA subunit of Tc toxin